MNQPSGYASAYGNTYIELKDVHGDNFTHQFRSLVPVWRLQLPHWPQAVCKARMPTASATHPLVPPCVPPCCLNKTTTVWDLSGKKHTMTTIWDLAQRERNMTTPTTLAAKQSLLETLEVTTPTPSSRFSIGTCRSKNSNNMKLLLCGAVLMLTLCNMLNYSCSDNMKPRLILGRRR